MALVNESFIIFMSCHNLQQQQKSILNEYYAKGFKLKKDLMEYYCFLGQLMEFEYIE
jgi:hypothetical protein